MEGCFDERGGDGNLVRGVSCLSSPASLTVFSRFYYLGGVMEGSSEL